MNDAVLVASERLRVRFDNHRDLWHHAIEFGGTHRALPALHSFHFGPLDQWPPSPPFQSLELQTVAEGRQVALLVGMAGTSHWSAAVEADPVAGAIRFDVACRFSNEPEQLGSSYRIVLQHNQQLPAVPRFEIVPIADDCRRELVVTDKWIDIRVSSARGPLPRTIRWKYVVSLPETLQSPLTSDPPRSGD